MNPFISVWKKVDRHPWGYDLKHYFWELIQWGSFLNTHMEQKYSHILSPFRIAQPSLKPSCYQSWNVILSKCLDLASWDEVLKILPVGKLSHSPLLFKVILEWVWNGTAFHFLLPPSIRPDFPPQPSDHKDSLWVLGLSVAGIIILRVKITYTLNICSSPFLHISPLLDDGPLQGFSDFLVR